MHLLFIPLEGKVLYKCVALQVILHILHCIALHALHCSLKGIPLEVHDFDRMCAQVVLQY